MKYEYETFSHGMEFNLDRYLFYKNGRQIVQQGMRRKPKNHKPSEVSYTLTEEDKALEEKIVTPRKLTKEELFKI